MHWRRRISGYSLLEVTLASAVCAGALVPALAFMRDGMTLATKIETRNTLLTCAVGKMEQQMAIVGASWTEGTLEGDFSAEGKPTIRFNVLRSDGPANGGIDDRLMSIVVTAYHDEDNDSSLDPSEARLVISTKVSKLISYESKANH